MKVQILKHVYPEWFRKLLDLSQDFGAFQLNPRLANYDYVNKKLSESEKSEAGTIYSTLSDWFLFQRDVKIARKRTSSLDDKLTYEFKKEDPSKQFGPYQEYYKEANNDVEIIEELKALYEKQKVTLQAPVKKALYELMKTQFELNRAIHDYHYTITKMCNVGLRYMPFL